MERCALSPFIERKLFVGIYDTLGRLVCHLSQVAWYVTPILEIHQSPTCALACLLVWRPLSEQGASRHHQDMVFAVPCSRRTKW